MAPNKRVQASNGVAMALFRSVVLMRRLIGLAIELEGYVDKFHEEQAVTY